MASFSTRFRYAYHVVPLHALKLIRGRESLRLVLENSGNKTV